ncbi:spore germination protein [Paenibacillus sp. N4]|uniref:spore germination protein n=1 Tax=Paenibacillus vietnamensis TaxID=2590547 RepID=UPI001CD1432E|nr:spore germination protein [Paenibacillus vietnamensis]MCA0753598.1 spore germination protein [Paenibacillus vietnamensis]
MEQSLTPIHPSALLNAERLQCLFAGSEFLTVRLVKDNNETIVGAVAYHNILVDEKNVIQQFIRKINEDLHQMTGHRDVNLITSLDSLGGGKELRHMETAADLILDAGAAVFIEGLSEAFGFMFPGYETRSIDEPKIEVNVRGPRESFIEDLNTNLSMIIRKLKTPDLKAKPYIIGSQSRTRVMLLYLESRTDSQVVQEVQRRLEAISLDILIVNTQIEELIQDSTYSPFPQLFNTERPDRVVTALNRGKIAILTDGTPIALLTPTTFFEMLHPSEDLYERFYFANFLRIIRVLTLFISLFGPALYIALTTFHLEMIPTPLMLAFISAKAGIPFPTFVEAIIMEVAFEVLREASLRLPRAVGQSVSIVGALIIGEAAVQSGIVSRPMVIVVAMTGIASFTIPSYSTAIAFRMLRFPMMLLAAWSGVLGLSLGLLILLSHLCSLHSCGIPFLEPVDLGRFKDTVKKYILLPVKFRRSANEPSGDAAAKRSMGGVLPEGRNDG